MDSFPRLLQRLPTTKVAIIRACYRCIKSIEAGDLDAKLLFKHLDYRLTKVSRETPTQEQKLFILSYEFAYPELKFSPSIEERECPVPPSLIREIEDDIYSDVHQASEEILDLHFDICESVNYGDYEVQHAIQIKDISSDFFEYDVLEVDIQSPIMPEIFPPSENLHDVATHIIGEDHYVRYVLFAESQVPIYFYENSSYSLCLYEDKSGIYVFPLDASISPCSSMLFSNLYEHVIGIIHLDTIASLSTFEARVNWPKGNRKFKISSTVRETARKLLSSSKWYSDPKFLSAACQPETTLRSNSLSVYAWKRRRKEFIDC